MSTFVEDGPAPIEETINRRKQDNIIVRCCRKKHACIMSLFALLISVCMLLYPFLDSSHVHNINELLTNSLLPHNNSLS